MNDPRLAAMGDTPGSDVCGCTRVMLEVPRKVCVYCGGADHPAECGFPVDRDDIRHPEYERKA